MATATVARPAQALRRRDAPRPTVAKRTNMDGMAGPAPKKRKVLEEPYVWADTYILQKHKGKAPSLTIHLHPTHFKFEGQDGSFTYDSEMKFLLGHLQRSTVPHQMMQELLENNVPFYDGRLIVEIHNHKTKAGKDRNRQDSAEGDDTVKFSMHNYNQHVTPSPLVPFPKKAAGVDGTPEKKERHMAAPEKPKEKDGPRIYTRVLHPTDLSKHSEIILLANTPATEARSKKKGGEGNTTSNGQPSTPQVSVPPTPISQTSRGPLSQSQKMCLEEEDLYTFQSEMLLATEPPLYLEPVDNPQDAEKVLEMLQHPLHQDKPPSPKTRKRTTAEVAADDAQAQETERRLLIMDERLKPTGNGAAANENQGAAAASLTFSRFKTIDMVRQKIEENERLKKEEEFRVSAEKKQQEEQNAIQQKAAIAQRQREMALMAQQQPNQQQNMMLQQQQAQQMRARAMAQHHAHPQQQNLQPGNQGTMQQSSPVVRQQTPMMNSSPLMPQGGFPMGRTSSQGAGSPPRPTSAAMQHHPMARQVSQQQRGSQSNTPQMAQATPSMVQAMPNRQMTQTPRMPPGSPAVGMQQGASTPGAMQIQTPHPVSQSNFTPEQMAMINQQRALSASQNAGMHAGSPQQNMTPDQFQNIQNAHRQQQQQQAMLQRNAVMIAQAQAQGNHQMAASMQARQKQAQQQFMVQRQQIMQAQQNAGMQGSPAPAGSPGQMPQQTPQMGHAHPQQHTGQQGNMQDQSQLTPQQHAAAQARA
ncbi:Transcription factor spt20, partial [Vermiconidia calcicola]